MNWICEPIKAWSVPSGSWRVTDGNNSYEAYSEIDGMILCNLLNMLPESAFDIARDAALDSLPPETFARKKRKRKAA